VPPTHHFHHVRHTIDGIDLGIAVLWCQQRLLAMSLAARREVALKACASMVPGAFQVVECFPPQLEQELLLALAGEPVCWSYDAAPVGGTDFQRRVWQQLERVEVGETISYGQLARRVGLTLLVSTNRPEVIKALAPDKVVLVGYGKAVVVEQRG